MPTTTRTAGLSNRYRHAYLLASLLLVIIVRPFFGEEVLGVALVDLLLFAALASGAYATIANTRHLMVVAALGVVSIGTRVAWGVVGAEGWLYGFLAAYTAFYVVVAYAVLRALFARTDRISADAIYGALSVYLILGLLWSMAFAALELAEPASFRFAVDLSDADARFERFLGFSFATLTTLGYGNVAPATPKADALATLEAIAGQVYLAIVIARLVALQIVQAGSRGRGDAAQF